MRKLFKKVWGGIKDNIGAIAGGALGGPIGALIGMALQEILRSAEFPISREAEKLAEEWAEKYFSPFFITCVEWVAADSIITNDVFVKKYNQVLMQLRSWQAYYEAVMQSPITSEINKEVAHAKQLLLLQAVELFKESYEQASVKNPSELFFDNHDYDPSSINEVAGDILAWKKIGVKSIKANNAFLTNGKKTLHSDVIKKSFRKAKKELPIADSNPEKDIRIKPGNSLEFNSNIPKPDRETKEEKDIPENNITPPNNNNEDNNTITPSLPNTSTNDKKEEETGIRSKGRNLLIGAAITAIAIRMFN